MSEKSQNSVLFANEQDKLKTDGLEALLLRCVDETLRAEGFPEPAEISVTFVDDEAIHELNLQARGVDRPTDVLSFPLLEWDGEPDFEAVRNRATGAVMLGDIVLSLERAAAQAQEYGHSFERETGFLCVHSMLHLLGYDHVEPDEEQVMRQRAEAVLQTLGLRREHGD
ncbi:rRNA maturation RNase YbeY [Feifania hominis]|uniref:rRNA maturation RNase YbeY n=1 Tax=Feifania hominis TaxID=2763660 RepID=UPI002016831B